MLLNAPPSVKRFVTTLRPLLTRPQLRAVVMFITGIVLAHGKRSLASIGRATVRDARYRGSVSRISRSARFRTRDLFAAACRDFITMLVTTIGKHTGIVHSMRRTWVLAIDDVSTVRGLNTKIANGLSKARKNAKDHPGGKTIPRRKSHSFVQALLLAPSGVRIPLPRKTWRTREYARKLRKKYVTKVALACEIVRDLAKWNLLPDADIVVVADNLYDSSDLARTCRRARFTLITPADSRRQFADGANIHERGLKLSDSKARRLILEAGSEGTASYRRRTARCPRINKRRHGRREYRFVHERRDVAGLGVVGVVYSRKRPVYRPEVSWERESFKVLMCSDPEIPGELVIELYELRWEIEVFYRELKSGLGLGQYTGTDFKAYERLVDLTLLTFLFLERNRLERGAELKGARLTDLKVAVEREAARSDLAFIEERLNSARGRATLAKVLKKLKVGKAAGA